jgi:hypothetical protein
MITKLEFSKNFQFEFSGSIDIKDIDLESKNNDIKSFLKLLINFMLEIKNNTKKQLSDDNKILYDERTELSGKLNDFLTGIITLALINSSNSYLYNMKYKNLIEITIHATKMKYFNGNGKLIENIPDIADYILWIDNNFINGLKRLITQFDEKGDKKIIDEEIIKLIFYSLVLRYKLEYIKFK